ncbi:acyl-CoA dehydrogenase family protein [Millisia brevis]|uniref:acyl-CoA dehydrogenase family protein n=1 Tax=Millisia brevis TaxID=264148 RepID=UPI0009FD47B4|nr:acyl-CoA dehydrogenase family protein [Millisia brevis]
MTVDAADRAPLPAPDLAVSDLPVPDLPVPDLSEAALAEVTRQLADAAPTFDRSGALPWPGIEVAHRAGLLTATIGRRYGGPEVSAIDALRILIALGEGDASVALLAANTLSVHQRQAIDHTWPDELYRDIVARSAVEPTLVNAIRAEPELGAPARGGLPKTVATRTSDGWVVNGHKAFATGGTGLAYHVVWVTADEPGGDPDAPRVGHILVPGDAPGIAWTETWDHLGLRASNTHDVTYRDVHVPAAAFLEIPRGADGRYVDPAVAASISGLGHPALYIGVARAARAAFVRYARERVPTALGRPIAQTERIRGVAGEIEAQIAQAETLLFGSLLRAQSGDDSHLAQASVIKVQIVRSAIAAVSAASAALGNAGLTRHQPFERLLRDVLCARVHPPQEDAALLAAGTRLLS